MTLPDYEQWTLLMYVVAIPYFFAAMAIEGWAIRKKPQGFYAGYELKDSLCSIAMGALKLVTMGLSVFWAYPFMVWLFEYRVVSWDISTWWFVPLLLVAIATAGYGSAEASGGWLGSFD